MGKFSGKVAFITGAARGQGRSHAVRLAEEGADIIALDICSQIDSVPYPLATQSDLEETTRLVEKTGAQIVAVQGDVRDQRDVVRAVEEGVSQFGRLDFVAANAGILQFGEHGRSDQAYLDAVDVMLHGVYNTVQASLPAILAHGDGGSIAITSSLAGLRGPAIRHDALAPGFLGYTAAKHGVVGLMRAYANSLAEKNIRVNTVHPSGVSTPLVVNEAFPSWVQEGVFLGSSFSNAMPVDLIEPIDISNAIAWLFSDEARYVTGISLPVDAGASNF